MTTGAAANPTLTIVALAIRQAEHLLEEMRRGDL
jgi:choline dehydrogenase-like flavoprotein